MHVLAQPLHALVVCLAVQAPAPERRYIVEIPRAADRAEVESRLALDGCTLLEELPALGLVLVAVPTSWSSSEATARLADVPGVGFAEPDGEGEGGGFVVPNDTWFSVQWPLHNTGQFGGRPGADIDALRGWELALGSANIVVAVLDSGITPGHPEFAGRVLPGHDFVAEDEDPFDDNGHGTLVSGILAANGDNAFGLSGVDRRCALLPVKILRANNSGSTFDLAQGLTFAADAGADVINMSLINYPGSQTLGNALLYARLAGCVLIACAGNGGIGDADRSFPGRSPLTISVGATTRFDARASYSGTGSALDVVAPGDEAPSTPRETYDGWVTFWGCSAATPVVSGIAALALSVDPTLTHPEFQQLLQSGAEDQVGPSGGDLPGRDDAYGFGRVNLFRTLCGLDAGGPTILAPDVLRIESPGPDGLAPDDPAVLAALAGLGAVDDLDPAPSLEPGSLSHLLLGKSVPLVLTAHDVCGHATERTIAVLAEDRRPPLLTLSLVLTVLEPHDGRLVPVGLRAGATDVCDPAPTLDLLVYADEPPARGTGLLDAGSRLSLRSTRDEAGDGRVYLLLVRARDEAGNVGSSCITVVVPHESDPTSIADVLAQAERAESDCLLLGGPPPGFFPVLASALTGVRAPKAR